MDNCRWDKFYRHSNSLNTITLRAVLKYFRIVYLYSDKIQPIWTPRASKPFHFMNVMDTPLSKYSLTFQTVTAGAL